MLSPPASQPPSTSSSPKVETESVPPSAPPPANGNASSSCRAKRGNQKRDEAHKEPVTRASAQRKSSAATSLREDTPEHKETPFSWDAYLKSTNSVAAPDECFFQSKRKLVNNFKIGYKLVVPDPRGLGTNCLGTITRVYKAWICVRLDGEDTSNDHWVVCDDSQLCPVRDGGSGLQPPVGFTRNPANFRMFVNRQLLPDKDGRNVLCPENWFTPIDSSCCPEKNSFLPGMKCELVERRNFNGAPCVVTVSEVNGDMLALSFDGSSDHVVKEHFQSRYIYPCGWGDRNEAPVIPPVFPGPKRQKRRLNRVTPKMAKEPRSKKARLTEPLDTSAAQAVSATRNDEEKPQNGIKVEVISEEARSTPSTRSSTLPPGASSSGVQTPVQEIRNDSPPSTSATALADPDSIQESPQAAPALSEAPLSDDTEADPASDEAVVETTEKAKSAETQETPPPVPEDPEANADEPDEPPPMTQPKVRIPKTARKGRKTYQRTINAEKRKVKKKKTAPIRKPAPARVVESDVVFCPKNENGVPDEIAVYINHGCARKSGLLDMMRVMDLPRKIGPTSPHHLYREVIQGLLNAVPGERIITAWNKLPVGNCKKLTVTACIKHMTYTHYLPVPSSATACVDIVRAFMNNMGICKNFLSTAGERCTECFHFAKRRVPPPPAYHDWSVEKTADFVAAHIGPELKETFLQNEIDGRAMSLLNQQNIMEYMKLSLGMAMKIVNLVNRLNHDHQQMLRHQFQN
uniref:SAM domain-containing protein n=1 Tax=Steinernema glaseri TaxID=37863 RepID=A0A1I8A755_9BILA